MRVLSKNIIVLGDKKVGKTSLLAKLTKSKTVINYISTFGSDYSYYSTQAEDLKYMFGFWDTNGNEVNNRSLSSVIYQICDSLIFVISFKHIDSLMSISKWVEHAEDKVKFINEPPNRKISRVLIITHSDANEKEFSIEEAKKHCLKYSFDHVITFSIFNSNAQEINLLLANLFPDIGDQLISQQKVQSKASFYSSYNDSTMIESRLLNSNFNEELLFKNARSSKSEKLTSNKSKYKKLFTKQSAKLSVPTMKASCLWC